MRAARERQAVGADDLRVLQIALRPAPVAHRDVDERRRAFFPRAVEIRRHAHFPAGAAHQRGFDEVVRQHVTAEGLASRQLRQAAGFARTRRRE